MYYWKGDKRGTRIHRSIQHSSICFLKEEAQGAVRESLFQPDSSVLSVEDSSRWGQINLNSYLIKCREEDRRTRGNFLKSDKTRWFLCWAYGEDESGQCSVWQMILTEETRGLNYKAGWPHMKPFDFFVFISNLKVILCYSESKLSLTCFGFREIAESVIVVFDAREGETQ